MGESVVYLRLLAFLPVEVVVRPLGSWVEFTSYAESCVWPCPFRVSPDCFSLRSKWGTTAETRFTRSCLAPRRKQHPQYILFITVKSSTQHVFCLFDESVFDAPAPYIWIPRSYKVDDVDHHASSGLLTGKKPRWGPELLSQVRKAIILFCQRAACKKSLSLPVYMLKSLPRNIPHKYFNMVMVITHFIFICHKSKGFCPISQLLYFIVFGTYATKDQEQNYCIENLNGVLHYFLFFNQHSLVSLHL